MTMKRQSRRKEIEIEESVGGGAERLDKVKKNKSIYLFCVLVNKKKKKL